VMRREQDDAMTEALEGTGPEVGGSARLEQDRRARPAREEDGDPVPSQPVTLQHLTWLVGHRDFEHRLRDVDGDRCILHVDSSSPQGAINMHGDFGTSMPTKSREESISSVQPTAARTALLDTECAWRRRG
jgi:hypothetical protein